MKNNLGIIAIILVLFFSCRRAEKIKEPSLTVTTDSLTLKAGDTVTFNLAGNPDYITFWSGEPGHSYANRNRTTQQGVRETLKFTTSFTQGNQQNDLSLKVSTNFDGIYDSADIAKATWTDITSRATLSTLGTATSSGNVDLSDFAAIGDSFYFAFYYYAPPNNKTPINWNVSADTIINVLADSTVNYVAEGFGNTSFTAVNILNKTYSWSISGSGMSISPGGVGAPLGEDWAISRQLNLSTVTLPDYGVAIKAVDAQLSSYQYSYSKPGTYTVTFWAANGNIYGFKSITRQLTIVVTP